MKTKFCPGCQVSHPATVEVFGSSRGRSDGLAPVCKFARSQRRKAARKKAKGSKVTAKPKQVTPQSGPSSQLSPASRLKESVIDTKGKQPMEQQQHSRKSAYNSLVTGTFMVLLIIVIMVTDIFSGYLNLEGLGSLSFHVPLPFKVAFVIMITAGATVLCFWRIALLYERGTTKVKHTGLLSKRLTWAILLITLLNIVVSFIGRENNVRQVEARRFQENPLLQVAERMARDVAPLRHLTRLKDKTSKKLNMIDSLQVAAAGQAWQQAKRTWTDKLGQVAVVVAPEVLRPVFIWAFVFVFHVPLPEVLQRVTARQRAKNSRRQSGWMPVFVAGLALTLALAVAYALGYAPSF